MTSSTRGAGKQEGGPHKSIPMMGRGFEYYQLCQHFHIELFVLLNNNKTQIPVLHGWNPSSFTPSPLMCLPSSGGVLDLFSEW